MQISLRDGYRYTAEHAATLVGCARCSTDEQDLTAQRQRPAELGAADERDYLDHASPAPKRARSGLDQALAAVRDGVPKLDRLARSVPDARALGDSLAERGIAPSLGRAGLRSCRWGRCSSTLWPPSPNSSSTFCGCAPAKARS